MYHPYQKHWILLFSLLTPTKEVQVLGYPQSSKRLLKDVLPEASKVHASYSVNNIPPNNNAYVLFHSTKCFHYHNLNYSSQLYEGVLSNPFYM